MNLEEPWKQEFICSTQHGMPTFDSMPGSGQQLGNKDTEGGVVLS